MTRDDYYQATDAAAAFMRLRLEELAATATAAMPGEWLPLDSGVHSADDESEWPVSETVSALDRRDREHIALNDPRTVLASVAADRSLLYAYERACNVAQPDPHDSGYLDAIAYAVRCRASAWAKDPGYKQEWRP
jgi:hypothetical protein